MARVTVKGLWKRYGDTVVLENINLDFADHEFVTIVGASGCGKTTFLRILLGMEQATRGKLLIDGRAVPPEPGPDRGIVFQRYSLFPHLTVLGNLILGLELRRSRLLGRLFGARRREAAVRGVEPGPPPILTDRGIVLIYNGADDHLVYRTGVAVFDRSDPRKVIWRSQEAVFSPEKEWEKVGQVPNVVFVEGMLPGEQRFLENGTDLKPPRKSFILYYGGADKYVGVAEAPVQ